MEITQIMLIHSLNLFVLISPPEIMEPGIDILVFVLVNPRMVDGVTLVVDDDTGTTDGEDTAADLDYSGRLKVQSHDTCIIYTLVTEYNTHSQIR